MPARKPITLGARYHYLTLLAEVAPRGRRYVLVQCDCGVQKTVKLDHLWRGLIKSCGCWNRKTLLALRTTHGGTGTVEYRIWFGMVNRCENKNNKSYYKYGARGIRVSESWHQFSNFLRDMGLRPPGKTLDRIKNDGHYETGNCRWATPLEQGANTRQNRLIEFRGERLHLAEWARRLGINHNTLAERLQKWPLEKALTQPRRHWPSYGRS